MSAGILVLYSGFPYTPSSFFPDNGLANLAGALVANGKTVKILDYATMETFIRFIPDALREEMRALLPYFFQPPQDPEIIAKFKSVEYQVQKNQKRIVEDISREILSEVDRLGAAWVGFKLYLGDGFEGSLAIASYLRKERPRLKLFAGGPQVDLFKEVLFQRTDLFDALVYAEGENVICDLVDYVDGKKPLSGIANTIYRSDSGKIVTNPLERLDNLDDLPYPCYEKDVYPALHDNGKLRIITFDESRGCPYHCAFCVHAEKSGLKMRRKSVDRMIKEIRALKSVCNTRVFRFAGSATPYKVLTELAERLIAEQLDIMYSIYGTAHHADNVDLPLLRKSGLWAIFYGIESAAPEILTRSMSKNYNKPEEMKSVLRATMDADIFTVASILYPAPFETDMTAETTFSFLKDVFKGRTNCSVPVSFPGLFPTTEWMKNHENYGFEIESLDAYLAKAMDYKIKSLLPYWLWGDVPYRLNGKSGRQLQGEAAAMIARLEGDGIMTMLLDDSAMIGSLANYDLRQYRRDVSAAFYTGNIEYVSDLMDRVNSAACVAS